MENRKGIITIRGNIEAAYKKLKEFLYRKETDYNHLVKVPEIVLKLPETESLLKFAMSFTEKYREAKPVFVDPSMIIIHSDIADMPKIEKDIGDFNRLYENKLQVETGQIEVEDTKPIEQGMDWEYSVGWS